MPDADVTAAAGVGTPRISPRGAGDVEASASRRGAVPRLPGTTRTVPFFGRAVRGRSFQSHSSAIETPARAAILWSVSRFLTTMRLSTTSGAVGSAAMRGARRATEPAGTRNSYAETPCGVARVL